MHRLIVLVLAVAGCSKPSAAPTAAPSAATVTVEVTTPKARDITFSVEQPGTVQAFESTPLVAKLPGYVAKVRADMGDVVEANQVLAEISIPELVKEAQQKKAQEDVATAEAAQSRASVEVAKAQEASADAMVSEARAAITRVQADYSRWETEFKRVEGLVANKVIDSQTLDETQKQFRSAAAMKEEMAAKLLSAEQMVRESKAKVLRATADVTAAEARGRLAAADAERVAALLAYTTIRAPYAGIVTRRNIDTGSYLQTSADPLFTVARLDIVRVFVDVPESAISAATLGTKVKVKIGPREEAGTITRTSGVLDAASRTLRTEIDLPNPGGTLLPGSYATVRIDGIVKQAMTVPAAAVLFADETAYVFEIVENKAVKHRVQVGRRDGDAMQVVGMKASATADWKPLTGNERIVVGNLGALSDGQAVEVKLPTKP